MKVSVASLTLAWYPLCHYGHNPFHKPFTTAAILKLLLYRKRYDIYIKNNFFVKKKQSPALPKICSN